MNSKLILPVAAFLLLAGNSVLAQNSGLAVPSRDPSGRTTIGQSTLGFGVPGGAAGIAQGPFTGLTPFNNGFAVDPRFFNPQSQGVDPRFTTGFNNGFVDPRFATGFNTGFVDPRFATGFDTGFVDPRFASNNGFVDPRLGLGNGFVNPFVQSFGFVPGLGTGFGPAFGPGAITSGGGIYPPFDPATGVQGMVPGGAMIGAPRGLNYAIGGSRTYIDTSPKTPEDFARARLLGEREAVAGSREELRGGAGMEGENGTQREILRAPATRDQVALANKLENLMAERPMREGLVLKIATDTVEVSYKCDGESKVETFPAGEVFFFRTSGSLATAATARGGLKVGDRVLVACEEKRASEPRQSVAGSREESSGGASRRKPAR